MLHGITLDTPSPNPTVPMFVFVVFQMMFAIVTPALITGAFKVTQVRVDDAHEAAGLDDALHGERAYQRTSADVRQRVSQRPEPPPICPSTHAARAFVFACVASAWVSCVYQTSNATVLVRSATPRTTFLMVATACCPSRCTWK